MHGHPPICHALNLLLNVSRGLHRLAMSSPYDVIDSVFAGSSGKPDWMGLVTLSFAEQLCKNGELGQVPLLEPTSLPGSLVRVIGMIRDSYNPEFYPESVILAST